MNQIKLTSIITLFTVAALTACGGGGNELPGTSSTQASDNNSGSTGAGTGSGNGSTSGQTPPTTSPTPPPPTTGPVTNTGYKLGYTTKPIGSDQPFRAFVIDQATQNRTAMKPSRVPDHYDQFFASNIPGTAWIVVDSDYEDPTSEADMAMTTIFDVSESDAGVEIFHQEDVTIEGYVNGKDLVFKVYDEYPADDMSEAVVHYELVNIENFNDRVRIPGLSEEYIPNPIAPDQSLMAYQTYNLDDTSSVRVISLERATLGDPVGVEVQTSDTVSWLAFQPGSDSLYAALSMRDSSGDDPKWYMARVDFRNGTIQRVSDVIEGDWPDMNLSADGYAVFDQALIRNDGESYTRVQIMDLTTGKIQTLHDDQDILIRNLIPLFSRDGKTIYFTRLNMNTGDADLYQYDRATGNTSPLLVDANNLDLVGWVYEVGE